VQSLDVALVIDDLRRAPGMNLQRSAYQHHALDARGYRPAHRHTSQAGAEGLSGHVRVVDGDSLKMGDVSIRLQAIDAPEWDQVCHRGDPPKGYRCGLAAKDTLINLIAGRPVDCVLVVQRDGKTTDFYERTLGRCSVGGVELNAWMVEHGHARAFVRYSLEYVPLESRARVAGVGIWAGPHMAPWDWRQATKVDREWLH
jgi:endonuclease YncB( thermonuclease family)